MPALTLINGQLRLNGNSQLVLAKIGTSGSDEPCCCDDECGFPAFDGSGRRYKYAMLIDFDRCYYTSPDQRVLPDGTPSPAGFDGFFVAEADCTRTPLQNNRTAGKIIYSFGGFATSVIYSVGNPISVPRAADVNSPANSATYASLGFGPGCGNPDGDKVGWVLMDKYP
jgi:hypothetical protein